MFPTRTRRRTLGSTSLLAPALWLLGGGLAVLALLWATGTIRWPLGQSASQEAALQIPIAARPIAAYAAVTHDDLTDPATRTFAHKRIPLTALLGQVVTVVHQGHEHTGPVVDVVTTPEGAWLLVDGQRVAPAAVLRLGEALLRPGDILGRVVARDKRPGFGFQESDFLPRGTRPGISGGTPPGKRALTLPASSIKGVHALRAGDRIDVLAHIPWEHVPQFAISPSRLPAAALVLSSASGSSGTGTAGKSQRTEAHIVAQNAVVVSPVSVRQAPTSSASLTQGQVVRHVPVEEIVLAVDPDDLPRLSDALSLHVEMIALAHSGRPGAEQEPPPPPGTLAVPVAARPLAAYEALRTEDLLDVRTRRMRTVFLAADEVQHQGIVADVAELTGRVLRRDMLPGEFFRHDDFLPRGTRPGLAGAVPAGKVSLVLPAERFPGIEALRRGDRCHIVGSVPIDLGGMAGRGTSVVIAASLQDRVEVRVLARHAVVLAPVGDLLGAQDAQLHAAAGHRTAARGQQPPEQFVLAVEPAELAPLQEALARGWELRCVLPTGDTSQHEPPAAPQASAPETTAPSLWPGAPVEHGDLHDALGSDPLRGASTLDLILGNKRQRLVFVAPAADVPQVRDALSAPAAPPGAAAIRPSASSRATSAMGSVRPALASQEAP
jgi:hypothetical protein